MGRYEKQDCTSAIDKCVFGLDIVKITDKETGKTVESAGWSKKEAEANAWKKLKQDG